MQSKEKNVRLQKKKKGSPLPKNLSFNFLGARWDLNPRPSGPQSDILTN